MADFSYATTAKSVHATMETALAAIPPEKRAALLIQATPNGAQAMVAARINGTWEVAAGGQVALHDKPSWNVALMGAW